MTREKAAALVAENLKTLYAWALSRTSNETEAEDLASEVTLAVIESAPTLKYDDAFFGWFWQVARNTYKSFLSKRSKHSHSAIEDAPEPSHSETPESILIENEAAQRLRLEIAILSKYHRECCVDYYFNGLSVSEIAEEKGLSASAVKYYLFKTRKILKEGIAMVRQFGEKSFNPAPFDLSVFFCGNMSKEYMQLFRERKLPGQVLSSAYYTPMSVGELSLELGVPSVYLEDEINVLTEYGFLVKIGESKYQTNILLMDEDYFVEAVEKSRKAFGDKVVEAALSIKEKLPEIRKIGFVGNWLSDTLITWDMLVYSIIGAYSKIPLKPFERKINDDTVGYCYATTCKKKDIPIKRQITSFANTYNNGNSHITVVSCGEIDSFAPFCDIDGAAEVYKTDREKSEIPALTDEEKIKLSELLSDEIEKLREVMEGCNAISVESLKMRAPSHIDISEDSVFKANFTNYMSLIFDLAEENGVQFPVDDKYVGIYVHA